MFLMQPDSETVKFASLVAKQANICAVRLLKINASSEHDPASTASPSNPEASFQIQDIGLSQPGKLSVTCNMEVTINWAFAEDSRHEGVSNWSLTFLAEYTIPNGDIPEEIRARAIPAFAAINVPYNLWPYFRQAIQSSASEMGIVGLVLPPLRYEPRAVEQAPETKPASRKGRAKKVDSQKTST